MLTSRKKKILKIEKEINNINKRISHFNLLFIFTLIFIISIHNVLLMNYYYAQKQIKSDNRISYLENEVKMLIGREAYALEKLEKQNKGITPLEEKNLIKDKVNEIKNDKIENYLGNGTFTFKNNNFTQYTLPEVYYPNTEYFFPYMDYKCITAKGTATYKINNDANAYTDSLGLRRYKVAEDKFKVNGQDDYMVALGTYYKKYKGELGGRYLVVTSTGMYTIMTGDEKADEHTDQYKMVSFHGGKLGMIEFIVDTPQLEKSVKQLGSINNSSNKVLTGKIKYIYRID